MKFKIRTMIIAGLVTLLWTIPALAVDQPAEGPDAACHYQTGQGEMTNAEWASVLQRCNTGHWIVVKDTPLRPYRPVMPGEPRPVQLPVGENPEVTVSVNPERTDLTTLTTVLPNDGNRAESRSQLLDNLAVIRPQIWSSDYIAPHVGSTISAWFEAGALTVRDYHTQASLQSNATCVKGQAMILASTAGLELWCTADDKIHIVQTVSPHPQDGRLDQLTFNADLTECFRSYWYSVSDTTEIWLRGC